VRLFLDASVLLAAAGSSTGASRAIFSYASQQNWSLVSSPYALNEVLRNLAKLPGNATTDWLRLRLQLVVVDDVVSLDKPTVLLTLDKADFVDILGGRFYGLDVLLPYDLLERERAAGRLLDHEGPSEGSSDPSPLNPSKTS
jgi:hypothetical protein